MFSEMKCWHYCCFHNQKNYNSIRNLLYAYYLYVSGIFRSIIFQFIGKQMYVGIWMIFCYSTIYDNKVQILFIMQTSFFGDLVQLLSYFHFYPRFFKNSYHSFGLQYMINPSTRASKNRKYIKTKIHEKKLHFYYLDLFL